MIYDVDQIYPEFELRYRRIFSEADKVEVYPAAPQQGKIRAIKLPMSSKIIGNISCISEVTMVLLNTL